MQRIVLFTISFLFCAALYGQNDSLTWRLCGQSNDQSVKAFFVSDKITCPNVLVFKKDQYWDTLPLCTYASMLPYFSDICSIQCVQMDGQGLNEVVLSWNYERVAANEKIIYTFYMIWDLDTRMRIFYMTPYYYRLSTEYLYSIDESGQILDTTLTVDSCVYRSDFHIDSNGQIINANLTQAGSCPDDECWKRTEGIYFYEDKKLQWKENNGG